MDGQPAFVVNSIEAEVGFYHTLTHRHTMRGYSFFFMAFQQNSEHLITVLRPGGGWSIPFSPSQLKWLEEELRQWRRDGWTWGNCPNRVEWFPNGMKRDTGEQADGWTDRFTITTGAPLHRCSHLFRVVSGDQCSPIEPVTGKWAACPRQLSTPGNGWSDRGREHRQQNKRGDCCEQSWWRARYGGGNQLCANVTITPTPTEGSAKKNKAHLDKMQPEVHDRVNWSPLTKVSQRLSSSNSYDVRFSFNISHIALVVALGSYSGRAEHSEAIKGGKKTIDRYFSDSLRISDRCLSPHLAVAMQLHTQALLPVVCP